MVNSRLYCAPDMVSCLCIRFFSLQLLYACYTLSIWCTILSLFKLKDSSPSEVISYVCDCFELHAWSSHLCQSETIKGKLIWLMHTIFNLENKRNLWCCCGFAIATSVLYWHLEHLEQSFTSPHPFFASSEKLLTSPLLHLGFCRGICQITFFFPCKAFTVEWKIKWFRENSFCSNLEWNL